MDLPWRLRCALPIALAVQALSGAVAHTKFLTPADITRPPSTPATERVAYGEKPQQFAELRLPEGKGPHPVVVVIHGGCWGVRQSPRPAGGPPGHRLEAAQVVVDLGHVQGGRVVFRAHPRRLLIEAGGLLRRAAQEAVTGVK